MKKLLSFNPENEDVYGIINSKSNASQYVCEAVRFYEQYKRLVSSMERIEDKLDRLSRHLRTKSHQLPPAQVQGLNKANSKPNHVQVTKEKQQVIENKIIDNDLKNLILNEED